MTDRRSDVCCKKCGHYGYSLKHHYWNDAEGERAHAEAERYVCGNAVACEQRQKSIKSLKVVHPSKPRR